MMRLLIPAAALALLAVQVQAHAQSTPATPAPATAAPAPQAAPAPKPVRHRQTLQQRYDAANVTHDDKLTKDQATAANWPYVVNNFSAIDKDKKGYVTTDDIRAFARARHAAQHKPAPAAPAQNNG